MGAFSQISKSGIGSASIGNNRLRAVTPTRATKGEGKTLLKRLG